MGVENVGGVFLVVFIFIGDFRLSLYRLCGTGFVLRTYILLSKNIDCWIWNFNNVNVNFPCVHFHFLVKCKNTFFTQPVPMGSRKGFDVKICFIKIVIIEKSYKKE